MTGVIITVDLKEKERYTHGERERGEKSDPIHGKGSIFHVSEQAARKEREKKEEIQSNPPHPRTGLGYLYTFPVTWHHPSAHLHLFTRTFPPPPPPRLSWYECSDIYACIYMYMRGK